MPISIVGRRILGISSLLLLSSSVKLYQDVIQNSNNQKLNSVTIVGNDSNKNNDSNNIGEKSSSVILGNERQFTNELIDEAIHRDETVITKTYNQDLIDHLIENDVITLTVEEQEEKEMENRKPIPSIAFMFMMTDQPLMEDMWEEWFNNASDKRKYSIYVHGNPSNTTVPLGKFLCPHAIPAVPTEYYWLHDGMMQLIQTAYDNTNQDTTSFLFISSTSIPLISFDELYEQIIYDNGKSRFCFFTGNQRKRVWGFTGPLLNLDMNLVQKAELWSVISRQHISILLKERTTMDHWNTVFREAQKDRSHYVGAPDELFFPTLLNMNIASRDEFQSNCSNARPINEGSLDRNTCCSTKVVWQRSGIVYIRDYTIAGGPKVLLSDLCRPYSPCTLSGTLHEQGLIALRNNGYWFLRKVRANNMVLSTNNETISLNDALQQLHKKQPMRILLQSEKQQQRRKAIMDDGNNNADTFHCPAPHVVKQ